MELKKKSEPDQGRKSSSPQKKSSSGMPPPGKGVDPHLAMSGALSHPDLMSMMAPAPATG
jgi:hypothetical protein